MSDAPNHTPEPLFYKVVMAHKPHGVASAMKASVTLKPTGRKPAGFEGGHAIPGETVKVPKELPLTQGAFGALAFRNATDADQAPAARVCFKGVLPKGVEMTDLALHAASLLPPAPEGAKGWGVELDGGVIRKLNIEERMRLCALLSEMPQVVCVIIAPDDVVMRTIGATDKQRAQYRPLHTDECAKFTASFIVETPTLTPHATWTTELTNGTGILTELDDITAAHEKAALPEAGTPMTSLPIDFVYIGPFQDDEADVLETTASVFRGRKIASGVKVFIIPGSKEVKNLAEQKGWDKTFSHSGCIWNPSPSEIEYPTEKTHQRAAQTLALINTKAHTERTHFMSAQMAATAAICGRIADVRDFI